MPSQQHIGFGAGRVSCVIDEGPRFHIEALRWYASLTKVVGLSATDLTVYVVGNSQSEALRYLRSRGVVVHEVLPFDRRHPPSNKTAGALALSRETFDGVCVLTDSDVVLFDDPRAVPIPADMVAMRPVDAERPPLKALKAIFRLAGVPEPPVVPVAWEPGGETLDGNANGGLYLIPSGVLPHVAQAWSRWTKWLLDRKLLPRRGNRALCTDQVAMALALASEGIGILHLDPSWNVPTIHRGVRVEVAKMIHYHTRVGPEEEILPMGYGSPNVDDLIRKANTAFAEVCDQAFDGITPRHWSERRVVANPRTSFARRVVLRLRRLPMPSARVSASRSDLPWAVRFWSRMAWVRMASRGHLLHPNRGRPRISVSGDDDRPSGNRRQ